MNVCYNVDPFSTYKKVKLLSCVAYDKDDQKYWADSARDGRLCLLFALTVNVKLEAFTK